MTLNEIRLNPQLRPEHHRVMLRYLTDELTLSANDWATLVEAVDLLSDSVAVVDSQAQTFRRFYSEQIDRQFADPFLARLLTLADLEVEGRKAQADVAREICRRLDGMEAFNRNDNNCRTLLIYCLYWWAAFARGYLFEVTIFRDLKASGIQFVSHNLTDRHERFTPYDLMVETFCGDIKYTTYFLTKERLTQLRSDFFITRWYLPDRRLWLRVTILREHLWHQLSSGVAVNRVAFDEVALNLPQPVAFVIDSISLIGLGYDQWKQLIRQIQSTKGE